jgi:hypothetical protein
MSKPYIEAGALASGARVFRMNCPTCKRVGVWQEDLNAVERTVAIHIRHEHAKAVA